ncbi:SDR family NAD(P)-dependent oxidoreductase [Lewinella sp. 4G2]|uniref:SDR family NAD(P)-dependent oxidoreductase n=1 Tax=Lewinella sp. 4G2 TaxID=1803372 RepID=UPI0007B4E3D9|nr:SDR family NAD(P)-dependent oxidoreductase [Lewinella sp. 4G2]OAV45306.1 3-oxoacyl-ACP reductase [Lewinella sp. 4G2]
MITLSHAGKKVLVTGSSKGVGAATARLFAEAGAQVAIHYYRDEEGAREVMSSLPGEGHVFLQADVSKPESAHQLVERAHEQLGGLDILVNNAGIFLKHSVDGGLSFDEWFKIFKLTMNTNLMGPAAASFAAIQLMRKQGGGKIINVGSRGAYRGEAGQVGYGAAKAGLHALSQSLAQEVGKDNITVHAIAPGFIETAMARPHLQGAAGAAVKAQSPLNRVATVDEVATAILFLASPQAQFTTGSVMDLNGASYLH